MSYPELYILRHGETEWNLEGRLQGSLDSPLTARGRVQAKQQRQLLAQQGLAGFKAFTSPQGRAMHTAEIALNGLLSAAVPHDDLREIGVGAWQGLSRAALPEDHGDVHFLSHYERAPQGEGFVALRRRCTAFLAGLEGPSVLITHGVTSRMLRLIVLGLPTENIADLPGGQGNVHHLSRGQQTCLAPEDK